MKFTSRLIFSEKMVEIGRIVFEKSRAQNLEKKLINTRSDLVTLETDDLNKNGKHRLYRYKIIYLVLFPIHYFVFKLHTLNKKNSNYFFK